MNEIYDQKLVKLIAKRNDYMEIYVTELDKINRRYVDLINNYKKKIKTRTISSITTVLICLLMTIMLFLNNKDRIIDKILLYSVFSICGLVLFIYILSLIILSNKKNRNQKLYQQEMFTISSNLKNARGYEDEASKYVPIVIGLHEKGEKNNTTFNKNQLEQYIKDLDDEYTQIIKERIVKMGMRLSKNAFIEYYILWKNKNNNEYVEIDINERRAIAERKSQKNK